MYVCREHIHLSRDKSRVVDENDADAGWLLCAPGHEIPEDEARRLGLIGDEPVVNVGIEVPLGEVGELVVTEAEATVPGELPLVEQSEVPVIMDPEVKRSPAKRTPAKPRPSRAKAKAGQ